MNAQQFQVELDALYQRAFKEGVCAGQISILEAIGAAELNTETFKANVKIAWAKMQQPSIIPAKRLPPMEGGK